MTNDVVDLTNLISIYIHVVIINIYGIAVKGVVKCKHRQDNISLYNRSYINQVHFKQQ